MQPYIQRCRNTVPGLLVGPKVPVCYDSNRALKNQRTNVLDCGTEWAIDSALPVKDQPTIRRRRPEASRGSKRASNIHWRTLHMARPYWSGQFQVSLVSFGIQLFPATDAKSEIHFHQINRRTGE